MPDSTSSPPVSRFPTFARLFSLRSLGRLLIVLAVLVTLLALLCAEETWRGKRAWNNYKQSLEAQGEKLDWKDYVPVPVPDDQNFAMTPFLAPLFDYTLGPTGQSVWRDTNAFKRAESFGDDLPGLRRPTGGLLSEPVDLQEWVAKLNEPKGAPKPSTPATTPALSRAQAAAEVLKHLEKYSPVLEELRAASHRPYARFNIHYNEGFAPNLLLPHLAVVRRIGILFELRACAELALDRPDAAWADTQMILYLSDSVKDEPFLISKLVQQAVLQIALQPVWEGLADHKWSEAQLREIQDRLGKIDLLPDATLRGERAFSLLTIEQMHTNPRVMNAMSGTGDTSRRWGPSLLGLAAGGWFYQNERTIARIYQDYFIPVVDLTNRVFRPSLASSQLLAKELGGGFSPSKLMARMLLPALGEASQKFAFNQTRVNQAIIACALERYRLAEGQYPDSLDALSPRFLAKLPHDLIGGQPLKYHRTNDGRFLLYSIGWNEKDDGGTIAYKTAKEKSVDQKQGDWIWQYPAP